MQDWSLKYRPTRLSQLVGQDVNREILQSLVDQGRLYNAMIFYGRSGCGKTTTARILANEMNAEVIELDAASNNGVDDARAIKDIAAKLALTGSHKIIIIDEAHMLSKSAWNALLKSIEEPNEKTHFIFCTTEYPAIPSTIRGRSFMFKFYSIPKERLSLYAKEVMARESGTLPDDVIDLIVKESGGQVRDMLKMLQVAVEQNLNTVVRLSSFLSIPDTKGMGSYLAAVLNHTPKTAIKVLKGLNTDLLEWCKRLEDLIYEMLEDSFGIEMMVYPITQTAKLRQLTQEHRPEEFGKVLDYLLRIKRAEEAYQQLYVLALIGVC